MEKMAKKISFWNKKAEVSYWLVRLMILLVFLLVAVLIISSLSETNVKFLQWMREWF